MLKLRITQLICAFMICGLVCSAASAETHWNLSLQQNADNSSESSGKTERHDSYNRSAAVGYFVALVPGFFIHGLGNMYADNAGTGFIMLCTEVGSVGVLMLAAAVNTEKGSGEPFDIKFDAAANVLLCISIGMFFGSWVWDIVTVGDEIQKRQKRKRVQVLFGQLPTCDSHNNPVFGLNLSINF